MSVIEDSEGIHLRYVPLVNWISGACFVLAVASLIIVCILLGSDGSFSNNTWGDLLFWLLIILLVLGSFTDIVSSAFLFAPIVTVNVWYSAKYIEISKKRIYGGRVQRYYFSQVIKFKSYKARLNFSQQYFLALVIVNRKTLKLQIRISDDKQETVRLIKKLNKIIRNK
jgi:hypothetical protein